jgi:hypothetical protein
VHQYEDIHWLHPSLSIPNYKFINFFSILDDDTALDSPWTLTPAAENELQFFESQLQTAFITRIDLLKPIPLLIFPSPHTPIGILAQENSPLEWLYLKQKDTKVLTSYIDLISSLIIQGRTRCLQILGFDSQLIIFPLTNSFKLCYPLNNNLSNSISNYYGYIGNHYPAGKLWDF